MLSVGIKSYLLLLFFFFFFFFFFFLSFSLSMVGSFPSGIVATHSFHCCTTVSSCVSGDLF
jgi:hypothetical protein